MALNEHKVQEADFSAKDIATLNDRPNADGMSAQALKERFDAGAKKVIAPKLNALIDELVSQMGASGIGITPIDGLSGYDVQNVLIAIKMLLDTKKSTETADIEIGKKFDAAEAQSLVKSISFAEGTGIFTITKYDGTVETIDTAIEKVALDVQLEGQQFVLTLADGTKQRVDLSAFLTQTEVKSSDTITLALENGAITARIANGSIKTEHLNGEIVGYFNEKTQQAVDSAAEAKVSEQNALLSANAAEVAKQAAQESQRQAALSETVAVDSANVAEVAAEEAKNAAEEAKNAVGGDYVPLDGSKPTTGPLQYNDGTTIHDYYGTHNITHGTASLESGVSPLGKNCIYLKTK